MHSQAGLVVSLLVLALVAGPALAFTATPGSSPSGGAVGVSSTDEATTVTENETNSSDVPLGGKVSAFMQSNAVGANASVENGMWRSAVSDSNASDVNRSIEKRTAVLERQQQRLEAQLDAFDSTRMNTGDPGAVAEMARLSARAHSLQSTINETSADAKRFGVNETRLRSLQKSARNMTGHEVASTARNLSLGPPEHARGGNQHSEKGGPPGATPRATNGTQDHDTPVDARNTTNTGPEGR
ncbi:MAG: hypothetical protein ACOCR6_01015 [archaeon]